MFTKVIANPPFGGSSSLSKKIVNALLENKVAEEMVVLAPPKTFYGVLDYSKELKCVSSYLNKTRVFEDAAVEALFLDHIVTEKQNKYKEPSDFLLDEKHKVFRNAVLNYNTSHKTTSFYIPYAGGKESKIIRDVLNIESKETLKEAFLSGKLFFMTQWTPSNGVHLSDKSEDIQANLKNNMDWNKKGLPMHAFYFEKAVQKTNFSNWWYSAKKRREGGLINFMFDILFILYGGDPSLLKYVEVIPNLDWSRPHDDAEILKEIGLPEDFLSAGTNYI